MYHHYIHEKLAEARSREFERMAREDAAAGRRARDDDAAARQPGLASRLASTMGRGRPRPAEIRIRYAAPADAPRLRSLEERAGAPRLPAPVVVVDIDGALLAAKSLRDGATVADPVHRGRGFEEVVALSVAGLGSPRR
ncbi:MAG TPA: hypothetical protein VHS74_12765 [Solirubrobacterales bacterium]|jgi:hypothetical protein|nr:hypothetical protein [Solirubrobacterales bacterium]